MIAIAALTFSFFRGLIDQLGHPSAEIGMSYDWSVALAAGLLILVGSVWRSRESAARLKPPGVL